VTEIPDHLLERSKARRALLTGGGGGDDAPAATASAEVVKAEAAPAAAAVVAVHEPAAPEPPKPVPHFMKASNERARIPIWAMSIVAALPLWGLVYAGTLKPQVQEREAFAVGAELYVENCAACHGAEGGGGTGYAFSGGTILQTFPNRYEQMLHIGRGSAAITGQAYGDPESPEPRVAGSLGVMPAFGPAGSGLTQVELELIVLHERRVHGEEDYGDPESEEGIANEAYIDELEERFEAGEEEPIDVPALVELFEESTVAIDDNPYPTQGELDAAGFNVEEE